MNISSIQHSVVTIGKSTIYTSSMRKTVCIRSTNCSILACKNKSVSAAAITI